MYVYKNIYNINIDKDKCCIDEWSDDITVLPRKAGEKFSEEATHELGLEEYIGFTKRHECEKRLRYRSSMSEKVLYFFKSIECFRNEGANTVSVSLVHILEVST